MCRCYAGELKIIFVKNKFPVVFNGTCLQILEVLSCQNMKIWVALAAEKKCSAFFQQEMEGGSTNLALDTSHYSLSGEGHLGNPLALTLSYHTF